MNAPAEIALIAALDSEGWIGRDGKLLCHLPLDLKHFKQLTLGQPVIMGRKTFESLGMRPLPGRTNIVLTRKPGELAGFVVAHDIESALSTARAALASSAASIVAEPTAQRSIWIIGGAEIYALFLPHVTRMELTRVETSLPGDVRFPTIAWPEWRLDSSEAHAADERHAHPFRFESWRRA